MNKYIYPFLAAVLLLVTSASFDIKAQCVTGCNNNTYVNSVDPRTIEYDNVVGVFHSSMAKEYDGTLKVWGQGVTQNSGNALTPMIVNAANYGNGNNNQLSGTILKFAAGSNANTQQFAVLTTNGLYIWGNTGVLVPNIGNVQNNLFRKVTVNGKADGLPANVSPGDVKMMFGTQNALTIVTCNGAAYMLSSTGTSYGDGAADSGANDLLWHRVSTAANIPLTGVIALRGTYQAFMALTYNSSTGTYAIYTWGANTRLGNSTGVLNRSFATQMTMPGSPAVTPKMIGMTASSNGKTYYLLSTSGRVFSLGENESKQLGNGTSTDSNNWVEPTASATVGTTNYTLNANVVWMSPQEHDGQFYTAAINVVTNNFKIWAWGDSSYGMLGVGGSAGSTLINPTFMPGNSSSATGLNYSDKILALETGGHTTILIKQCTNKFGYVGHKINGSMADGTNGSGQVTTYNFADTAVLSVCGAVSSPVLTNVGVCSATSTVDLTNSEPATLPQGATGINWWTDVNLTIPVPDIHHVGPGTYYASFAGFLVQCGAPLSVIVYTVGSPGYNANCACYNNPSTSTSGVPSNHGITLLKRAGTGTDNWPMIRNSAYTVLESNTKGFVITRMTSDPAQISAVNHISKITTPQEGMMVYDIFVPCLKIYDGTVWKCFNTVACP